MFLCIIFINKKILTTIFFQVSVKNRILTYCNEDGKIIDKTKDYIINRTRPNPSNPDYQKTLDNFETEQVAWAWILIFAYVTPELVGVFLRSLRMILMKPFKIPPFYEFIFVFGMETLHVIGLVILAFLAFPQMDSAHVVVLTNCLSLVPGILLLLSRSKRDR